MKNRDQIRARNALTGVRGKGAAGGEILSGFPALVINNGLLSTLAFCIDKGKGHEQICQLIAEHLADREIALYRPDAGANPRGLLDYLTSNDSTQLRLCTAETLAYLNYLKRLAPKEDKKQAPNAIG